MGKDPLEELKKAVAANLDDSSLDAVLSAFSRVGKISYHKKRWHPKTKFNF